MAKTAASTRFIVVQAVYLALDFGVIWAVLPRSPTIVLSWLRSLFSARRWCGSRLNE